MSRPTTRAKNANQHPGRIVLESMQKRRTSEQKQADDRHAEQQRLEQEAARERGTKRIISIMDQLAQREEQALTSPLPRPQPRIIHKASALSIGLGDRTSQENENHSQIQAMVRDHDQETRQLGEGRGDRVNEVEDEVWEDRDSLPDDMRYGTQLPDQMLLDDSQLAGDISDNLTTGYQEPGSVTGQKRKQVSASAVIKDDISGVKKIEDWADKISSAKPYHSLISQRSRGHGRGRRRGSQHSRTTSNTTNSHLHAPRGSPASTPSDTHASTPYNNPSLNAGGSNVASISYIDGLDEEDPQPPPPSQPRSNRKQAVLIDVVSDSEPDEDEEHQHPPEVETASNSILPLSVPPPSKRARVSHRQGSGVNKKYINTDLPAGATSNNMWRRVFISTVAHLAGGYENAWHIPDDNLLAALQKAWGVVYGNTISHSIAVGGPVYYISKQSLSNWRSGFASAAMAIITAFFAGDPEFTDEEKRQAFAEAMLVKNRFLFCNNKGLDNKAWSGLWRSPFLLQTFAHHYNYIQGHVNVTGLPLSSWGHGARGALALACAALARVLTLVANGDVGFQPAESVDAWTPCIPKGSRYEFNENLWGATTHRYYAPIRDLSDEQFDLVVNEAYQYVKTVKNFPASVASSGDDDFDDLFAFR